MSKDISAPLLRTARLLDLVPFLNTHQGISLKELAQHFGVTPTQMSADLTTLWMCGLPGYTPLELMDLEFESGYVSIRNAPTLSKPRVITFQEGVVLLLGLDLIASSLPEDRLDLLVIIDSLRKRLTSNMGTQIKLSAAPHSSSAVISAIKQAIANNAGLSIRYHSLYKDLITDRVILPIEQFEIGNHQYLRAYCYSALDYREFRIDRIEHATPSAIPESIKKASTEPSKIAFSIITKNPSRDVIERFGIANSNSGKSIQLSSFSKQWIERSVMAAGSAILLESPLNIRAEVARKAQLMLDRYNAN